jgi:hypothetical protein
VSNDQDPAADPFGIFPEVQRARPHFPLPDPATLTVGQMLWGYQVGAELIRKQETETSWNVVTDDRIDRLNKMFLASPGYREFSAWANIELGREPSYEVATKFLGRLARRLRKRFEEIYPLPLLDAVRLLAGPEVVRRAWEALGGEPALSPADARPEAAGQAATPAALEATLRILKKSKSETKSLVKFLAAQFGRKVTLRIVAGLLYFKGREINAHQYQEVKYNARRQVQRLSARLASESAPLRLEYDAAKDEIELVLSK